MVTAACMLAAWDKLTPRMVVNNGNAFSTTFTE